MAKNIQKWSLEVVAVPQEESIVLPGSTATDKTIPIKVKIRIKRGKNNSFFRERFISVPKIEQANEYTEKVRIVYSDQTIMSFNMLTKLDHKSKTHRKSQNRFFHLFKTGKCLGTQGEDENDPPYLIAPTVKSNEVNLEGQESYDKQNIRLIKNRCKTLEEVTKQPVIFLGKCKPGGCLDPPFGEERYQYEPSVKQKREPDLKNKENYEVITCDMISEQKTKLSEVTVKISNYEEINTISTLMLYKAKSEKSLFNEKYSDSIITYPPDTHDIGSSQKNIMSKKSSAAKNRLSSNAIDTYFMPPKKDKSPERNIRRNTVNINSHKKESKDYHRKNDISVPEDRGTHSLLLKSSDLHLIEVPKNIVLDVEELKEPVFPLKIETVKLNEIDKDDSKTMHSLKVHQTFNENIDDTKSQNILQTEDINEINTFRASPNDFLLETINVISPIRDKGHSIIEANVFQEVDDKDTKSNKNTTIKNKENNPLKHTSIEDNIDAIFSRESSVPFTSDNTVDNVISEINKVRQPFNLNIDCTKSQNNILQTDDINTLNTFRDSPNDILSKTLKVIPQISDKTPFIVETNVFQEVDDEDTKSKKHTTIENEEIKPLKQTNIDDNMSAIFSQESSIPYKSNNTLDNIISEKTKVQYAEEKIPSNTIQTSSSIKSNGSHTIFRENSSDNNVTLPRTMKNGTIELKSIGSHEHVARNNDFTMTSSVNDNDMPETKYKYDNKIKTENLAKVNSGHIHSVSKSNIKVHVIRASPRQSDLSDTIIGEQRNTQGENITKELLDRMVLLIDKNNDNKYEMNFKDIPSSYTKRENTESEVTSDSLDKIKPSPTSSNDYKLEIESHVGKPQIEDKSESFHSTALKQENAKRQYEDSHKSSQDYKELQDSDFQVNDETSNNMIQNVNGYHQKDIITGDNVNDNTFATISESKNDKNLIYRESSSIPTSPKLRKYLNNGSHDKISSKALQHTPLYELSKNSTDKENTKIIEIDNDVTQIDSITNLKRNIEIEKNEIKQNTSLSENVDPIKTQDTLVLPKTLVVHKRESDSGFQNNGKNTSDNTKNDMVYNMFENKNISKEKINNSNEISLKNKSISEPVKVFNKTIPSIQPIRNDILRHDFMPHTRKDVRISFEDQNPYIEKPSSENDKNKLIILDLAFQTYINDNNEKILRTFDNSKEPQRFPHDNISVIRSALDLNNNKLLLTIDSNTKLSLEINSDNDKPAEFQETSHKSKENMNGEHGYIVNNKVVELRDMEKLQSSLAAIYENDLIPVENLIRDLIIEVDKIAKYRSLIKNKLTSSKKRRLLKQTNCNKICECLKRS